MNQLFIGTEKLSLGKKIGKGGEGEVYLIEGKPNFAAKLYYSNIRSERKEKVNALVRSQLYRSTDLVSFPHEVLINSQGEFVGFSMRLVHEHFPMHELYSPKSRKKYYPAVDFRFMVRAACNVSRAVAKVHASGCVIGDFNHSGVLISKKATVALIDADSFQFSHFGNTYLCEVGMPEFTPPELQNISLRGVQRDESSDLFGLAVAIFQLLFMGRHPYSGVGGPDLLEETIKQNRFAYSVIRQRDTNITPPPGMFTLKDFPLEVSSAFERAFGESKNNRPSAESWAEILGKLENSLLKCRNQASHYYPVSSRQCLWCQFYERYGLDMFPTVETLPSENQLRIDEQITSILMEIQRFEVADLNGIIPTSEEWDAPSLDLKTYKTDESFRLAVLWVMVAATLIAFYNYPNILWLIAGWVGYTVFKGDGVKKDFFKKKYVDADQRLKNQYEKFLRRLGYYEVLSVAKSLESTITSCMVADFDLKKELKGLSANSEKKQRYAYLDRYRIQSAEINGIGLSKKATLRSFGIETAADISSSRVRAVPGFGEVFTARLVAWRKSHEVGFKYNSAAAVDAKEESTIRNKYRSDKVSYFTELKSGLRILKGVDTTKWKQEAMRDVALMQAAKERFVAANDLKALNISVPTSVVKELKRIKVNFPQSPQKTTSNTATPAGTPSLKCPVCRSTMVKRKQRKGRTKRYFWGCSRYPRCRGTRTY